MARTLKILVLEDDELQARPLQEVLAKEFLRYKVEIVNSEATFRARVEELVEDPPSIVILDILVPWQDPRREAPIPQPDDVKAGGYYRAGIRAYKFLRERCPDVPVIFHSVLEWSDVEEMLAPLPDNVIFVDKSRNPEVLLFRCWELIPIAA